MQDRVRLCLLHSEALRAPSVSPLLGNVLLEDTGVRPERSDVSPITPVEAVPVEGEEGSSRGAQQHRLHR